MPVVEPPWHFVVVLTFDHGACGGLICCARLLLYRCLLLGSVAVAVAVTCRQCTHGIVCHLCICTPSLCSSW